MASQKTEVDILLKIQKNVINIANQDILNADNLSREYKLLLAEKTLEAEKLKTLLRASKDTIRTRFEANLLSEEDIKRGTMLLRMLQTQTQESDAYLERLQNFSGKNVWELVIKQRRSALEELLFSGETLLINQELSDPEPDAPASDDPEPDAQSPETKTPDSMAPGKLHCPYNPP